MNLVETLLSANDGGVLKQLAGQFGLNGDQVSSAIGTLVPALAGGLKEKLAAGGGTADVVNSLISGGTLTKFLDNPSALGTPAAVDTGKNLLTQIFGGGDLTNLTSTVAEKTGLSADVISKILPVAATLLGSFLSKGVSSGEGGSLTDMLGSLSGDTGLMAAVKSLAAKVFG